MELLEAVAAVRRTLAKEGPSKRLKLLDKLTEDPEHEAMWRSLAKRHARARPTVIRTPGARRGGAAERPFGDDHLNGDPGEDWDWEAIETVPPVDCQEAGRDNCPEDAWVWAFLEAVEKARSLPDYCYFPNRRKRELGERLRAATTELKVLYEEAGLSLHVLHLDGEVIRGTSFRGLHVFEAMSWEDRARVEERGYPQIPVTEVLAVASKAAMGALDQAPKTSKTGKNVRAIRFLRVLAARNRSMYGTPLLAVIATVTNTLYHTDYAETDIRALVNQRRLGNVG